jgi:hypothetical protein
MVEQFTIDVAFKEFIVSNENLTKASLAGYELGIDFGNAAAYYAYLIALPSAEKQPAGLMSFFRKKENIEIDYRNIVLTLNGFIMKGEEFGEFCEKWTETEEVISKSASIKNNLSLIKIIQIFYKSALNAVQKDKVKFFQKSINSNLEKFYEDGYEDEERLFKLIDEYLCGNTDWSRLVEDIHVLEEIVLRFNTEEKNIISILFLSKIRKLIHKGELLHYGVEAIDKKLIENFRHFKIEYIENNEPPSVLF